MSSLIRHAHLSQLPRRFLQRVGGLGLYLLSAPERRVDSTFHMLFQNNHQK